MSAAASDDGDRQHGRRIDTTFLTSADRMQQQKLTKDEISSLPATSASERKLRTLATAREDSDPSAGRRLTTGSLTSPQSTSCLKGHAMGPFRLKNVKTSLLVPSIAFV